MSARLLLLLAALPLLNALTIVTPTRTRLAQPRMVAATRTDEPEAGSACRVLTSEQLKIVSSMLEERDTAYQYVFCDAPSDDPNTTCFLLPDSWLKDIGEQQGEWVCMHNHVGVTLGLSAEDSY